MCTCIFARTYQHSQGFTTLIEDVLQSNFLILTSVMFPQGWWLFKQKDFVIDACCNHINNYFETIWVIIVAAYCLGKGQH